MATNYPTSLDVFTDPVAADALNSVTVPHATQHANVNDAVIAVETELGNLPKGTFGNVVARLNSLAPLVAPSLTGTATITASGAANIPLIAKGVAAQTASLFEAQNSSSTVLARISAVGDIQISGYIITPTVYSGILLGGGGQAQIQLTTSAISFANGSATVVGVVGSNGVVAAGTTAGAPTLASAATIAPVTPIAFVSGVTTINTITAPAPISTNGGAITLIPTGVFLTSVAGNISIASTTVVGKALIMTYDPITTKWYPSY